MQYAFFTVFSATDIGLVVRTCAPPSVSSKEPAHGASRAKDARAGQDHAASKDGDMAPLEMASGQPWHQASTSVKGHIMRYLFHATTRLGRGIRRFLPCRLGGLFLLSICLCGVLVGSHTWRLPIAVSLGEPGSGQGAGGMTVSATTLLDASPSCWPTDTNCLVSSLASQIAAGVQAAFQPLTEGMLKNPVDILYQTPLLTNETDAQNQTIRSLNAFFVTVVDLAFACLLVIAGYNVLLGRHLLIPFSTLMEILPRAVLVMVAVHFNLFFLSLFIAFENALSLAVFQFVGAQMLTNVIAGLFAFQDVSLLTFLLIVVLGILSLLLFLQMVTRIALVALTLVLAPLGLGCFFLPQTMRWGRLWLSILSSSLLVQLLQVLALGLGGVFLSALARTSFVHLDQSLATLLLAIGTMSLVLKIPGMLQTWALHPMMDTGGKTASQADAPHESAPADTSSASSTSVESGEGTATAATETAGAAEGAVLLL